MRFVEMRGLVFVSLTVAFVSAFALGAPGNGSGSVGNKIPIDDKVRIALPSKEVQVRDGYILDSSSGERLLRIGSIGQKDLARKRKDLISARLGSLKGFEVTVQASISAVPLPEPSNLQKRLCNKSLFKNKPALGAALG